jgi:inner membrane protein
MSVSLLARMLVIAVIAVVLLVPIKLIEGKIAERRRLAEDVVAQFAKETSGPQGVAGPLLALTCEETIGEGKPKPCDTAYFTPRTLKVAAKMPVETRYRGLYQIRSYRAALDMTGEFDWPETPPPGGPNRRWKKAYLVTAVCDPRGIKAATSNPSPMFAPATNDPFEGRFALQENLGEYAARKSGTPLAFSHRLELAGTSSLQIAPVGDTSDIRLASDWPHPSFTSGFSPDERRVSSAGFEAVWRTTPRALGGRAQWDHLARDGKLLAPENSAGVSLFDPVNIYTLSYRATEYAFLFVLFTFTALALAEATAGIRLHGLQYALVGSALAVFFLLLIALSEHIAFAHAYVCAAAACVALLTFYLRHPLGTWARTAAFFAIFVGMYGSLFVLLRSEDYALLLGSLMVFALLATVMIATRKIDWGQSALSYAAKD